MGGSVAQKPKGDEAIKKAERAGHESDFRKLGGCARKDEAQQKMTPSVVSTWRRLARNLTFGNPVRMKIALAAELFVAMEKSGGDR